MNEKSQAKIYELRLAINKEILRKYPTIEQFCWDNDLNKATLSNFLNSKKDPKLSTIIKIIEALGKDLVIDMK